MNSRMQTVFFFIFVVFPVLEIFLLGRVSAHIGLGDTLILLVFAAFLGAYLIRVQGKITLLRVQEALAQGRTPTAEMLDGVMVFFAGVLFLIPGFLSDLLGFVLFFPLTRWVVTRMVLSGVQGSLRSRAARTRNSPGKGMGSRGIEGSEGAQDAEIIG
ncbi:MAG: FxsA family protein [Elusimicrobia bacterium]|nr:FxsA family protein [Elusimicrobiota bacterium]